MIAHCGRALAAEWVKLRRTPAVWFIFVTPLLLVAFHLLLFAASGMDVQDPDSLVLQSLNVWAGMMLPATVVLQTGLLANLEHRGRQWKHLFSVGIPRGALFAAKWLICVGVVIASSLAFMVGLLIVHLVLGQANPALLPANLARSPLDLLTELLLASLASCLMISIHLWLSLRARSLVGAFGLGMVLFVLGLGFMWSKTAVHLVPWTLGYNAVVRVSGTLVSTLAVGGLGGLLVGFLAGLHHTRRDVL